MKIDRKGGRERKDMQQRDPNQESNQGPVLPRASYMGTRTTYHWTTKPPVRSPGVILKYHEIKVLRAKHGHVLCPLNKTISFCT